MKRQHGLIVTQVDDREFLSVDGVLVPELQSAMIFANRDEARAQACLHRTPLSILPYSEAKKLYDEGCRLDKEIAREQTIAEINANTQ